MLHEGAYRFTQISRTYRAAEADAVQAAVHYKVLCKHFQHKVETALGHYFTEDDARNYGIAGEVTLAVEGIVRDTVCRMAGARSVYGSTLHKEHRLPMGKISLDFFFIHQ